MRRDDLMRKLKGTEPALRGLGVEALYLFGSHARDEARDGSDIDIFVDPVDARTFGFHPFIGVYRTIKDTLGCDVDYGTRAGLHPRLRPAIEREAVRVF